MPKRITICAIHQLTTKRIRSLPERYATHTNGANYSAVYSTDGDRKVEGFIECKFTSIAEIAYQLGFEIRSRSASKDQPFPSGLPASFLYDYTASIAVPSTNYDITYLIVF